MENDVEKLHALLLDAKLPSTTHELRNPTKEFIINLMIAFLKRFKIDVNLINKPTFEQLDVLQYFEDTDIVCIINLYVVMKQICDRIFLPEFYVSDLIDSGSKKVRKFARYLANFILYATNKESDIEDITNEIYSKVKLLEELQERKKEILTLQNKYKINISKQLFLKEKYEMEIENLRLLVGSKGKLMVEENIVDMEEKRLKVVEDWNAHKLEAQRLDKAIADLKLEVVESPEIYKARLYDLEEQNKAKIEERKKIQEVFLAKNQLDKKYENIFSFIQKQYKKFPEIKDKHENLKKVNIHGENIKEQVDTMKNNIAELIKKHEMQDHQETTINEIYAQIEERLTGLRKLRAQLLSNMKLEVAKLEEDKALYCDSCMNKNKIQTLIEKIEGDTSTFIKNCQERYNNEVLIELNLWKSFEDIS